MGVCAGKTLTIWSELAVKNSSMTLTFNLGTTQARVQKPVSELSDTL